MFTYKNLRQKTYLAGIALLMGGALYGQQSAQYSMYALNPFAINPATAGLDNTLVLNGQYRKQWSGLQGAPVSAHFNGSLPLYVIRSGIGFKAETESIGAHNVTSFSGAYNYQIEIGRKGLLSIGLGAGFLQYNLDGVKLRAPEGTYNEPLGIFDHKDGQLPAGRTGASTFTFEAGIFLQTGGFEAGLSVLPAFAGALTFSEAGGLKIAPAQHYLCYGAYNITFGDEFSLKPSFLIKTDAAETQSEISVIVRRRENIFAGASFRGFGPRAKDSAVILAGLKINEKTTLAYAFDIPLSVLSTANRGSHELLLRYSLNKPVGAGKLPPVIYNPRFI